MSSDAVRRFGRVILKVTVVVLLAITVMWVVGEVIQALSEPSDDTATTEER